MVITTIMLGLIYLLAYAPSIDTDPNLQAFAGYPGIINIFTIISLLIFAILSAVMYTKFIIEDYKGKRSILLFTYPTDRKKVLLSKFIIVFTFTFISMFICNLIVFTIFSISEHFISLVNEELSFQLFFILIKNTFIAAITAGAIGIISAGIGFIKKSLPTTIISSLILSSLICNITANLTMLNNTASTPIITTIFMFITIVISTIVSILIMNKVNIMEV